LGQSILLRGARQLLTLRGPSGVRRGAALHDLGIIEDGSVLIQDGVITQVGTSRRIENLKEARGALEIAANGHVVMPAFVDAHLDLNIHDPAEVPEGLPKRRTLTKFYEESLALTRACLQHGTLTAEVKASAGSGNIQADAAVIKQLLKIGNNPIGLVRTWRIADMIADRADVLEEFQRLLASLMKKKLIVNTEIDSHLAESPVLGALLAAMQAAGIGTKLLWRGGSPERLSDLITRLSPRTVCSSSQLSPAERSVLAAAPGIPVFSPCKEVSEGATAGNAPYELASTGAPIALSTGFHFRRSPSCSMQMALSFAVLHLRLKIEQAITAATINAAHAVGVGHLTGSIEVGKRADLLILTLADYREIPRQYGINHVGMAIRDGNVVFNRTRWNVGA
jgi:imidazolonepropionase